MARCAVCLLNMRPGEKFALVEEFVIHRACVGGVIVIRDKARTAEQEAARHAQKYLAVAKQLDDIRDQKRELHQRLNRVHDDLINEMSTTVDLKAQLAHKEEQLARERNARALAELQARSTRQPQVVEKTDEQIPPPQNEPVDITAERFRLLELD